MSYGVTTSVRLPANIRDELEMAARKIHRGKNWIILKALEAYLAKLNYVDFEEEARRQSILASRLDIEEVKAWENNSDNTGWT